MATTDPHSTKPAAKNPPARSRRRVWLRRLLIATPIVVGLYALGGFFGVPWLARSVVAPKVSDRLNGELRLARVSFNPFTFWIELDGVSVVDDQGERVAGLDHLEANFDPFSAIGNLGWHVRDVRVVKPFLAATVREDGSLNLAQLFKPSDRPTEPLQRIPRVVINQLAVEDGDIHLDDLSQPEPFALDLGGLTFRLTDLDTRPENENEATLRATTDGGAELAWTGMVQTQPFASRGTATVKGIDLPRFMPYGLRYTTGRVTGGSLSAELEYDFEPVAAERIATATVTKATIDGLRLEHDGAPVLEAPTIELADAAADFDARSLTVAAYRQTGGFIAVTRDADGTISLVRMIAAAAPETPDAGGPLSPEERVDPLTIEYPVQQFATALRNLVSDAAGPWSVAVESISVKDHELRLADRATRRPVDVTATVVAFDAGPVRSDDGYAIPFTATLTTGESGRVESSGTLGLFDRQVELAVKLEGVHAEPYAPYLPLDAPPVRFRDALLELDGSLTAQGFGRESLDATWTGTATLAAIRFEHDQTGEPILLVERLGTDGTAGLVLETAGGARLAWEGPLEISSIVLDAPTDEPLRTAVASVRIDGTATVERKADGSGTMGWSGAATVSDTDVSGRVTGADLTAAIAEAVANGTLTGGFAPGAAPSIEFAGTSAVRNAQAETSLGGSMTVATREAGVDGTVTVRVPAETPAEIAFAGTASVAGASLALPQRHGVEVGADSIAVSDVDLSTAEQRLSASTVSVQGGRAAATIQAVPDAPPSEDGPARSGRIVELSIPYAVRIDRVVVDGATAQLRDPSAVPPIDATVDAIRIEISGIDTANPQPATVAMSATVQRTGKISADGTIDLLSSTQSADLQIDLADVPLPPFSSVSGWYAGYAIDEGRLTVDMPLEIEGPLIRGELDFALDRIELGEKVQSPVAPNLPLDLGIAVLRDANGRVEGDVPFEGDMSSPSFDFGDLIFRAIFSLIGKVATAPFQLIASAFGAGDLDISMVAFEPGTAELADGEVGKLDVLGKALAEKPELRLEIDGRFDPVADAEASRAAILREQMLEQLRQASPGLDSVSDSLYRQGGITRYAALPPDPSRPADPAFEQMEAAVLATIEVPRTRLVELARSRAERVASLLREEHGIDAERLAVAVPEDDAVSAESPRASFTLK